MPEYTAQDAYNAYPAFYGNPMIQELSMRPRWTFSKEKVPMDMFAFLKLNRFEGCQTMFENSMVTLPELLAAIPNINNHAYYLDCYEDGYVCLDIEKTCPDDIKEKLLNTDYVYGERSLSGLGYHLFYPEADFITDYPVAADKIVLKEEHGYYEIHRCHWVTFTRDTLRKPSGEEDFYEIYEQLCKNAKETARTEFDITKHQPDIPRMDDIEKYMASCLDGYRRKPEDFSNDLSKFEFGYFGYLYTRLNNLLNTTMFKDDKYDNNQRMWIIYLLGKDHIPSPHRKKHDEFRAGLPWFLYLSREVVAKFQEDAKKGN